MARLAAAPAPSPPAAGTVTDRILDAGAALLVEVGWERTTMSAVAARAGITRPTLYARYANRDELFADVALRAAEQLTAQVMRRMPTPRNGATFVVDLVTAWMDGYRSDRDAAVMGLVRPGRELSDRSIAIVRSFLDRLVVLEPQLGPEIDEIAETMTRFIISLMQFESSRTRTRAGLRGYVRRRLLPAIGLDPVDA